MRKCIIRKILRCATFADSLSLNVRIIWPVFVHGYLDGLFDSLADDLVVPIGDMIDEERFVTLDLFRLNPWLPFLVLRYLDNLVENMTDEERDLFEQITGPYPSGIQG